MSEVVYYIHSSEMGDRGKRFDRHKEPVPFTVMQTIARSFAAPHMLFSHAVKRIGERPLHLLVLNGHGHPGIMRIGEGFSAQHWHEFRVLAPLFRRAERPAGIEIHACQFAGPRLTAADIARQRQEQLSGARFRPGGYREGAGSRAPQYEGLPTAEDMKRVIATYGKTLAGATAFAQGRHDLRPSDADKTHFREVMAHMLHGVLAMQKIAAFTGVQVKGGFHNQYGDPGGGFEGPYAVVTPGGSVSLHQGRSVSR